MRLVPFTIALLLALPAVAADAVVKFDRDIRPILSENCYLCHGPDKNARQADLRLDTEEGAKESAIVEGDADASDLIDRITSSDPDSVMPPPDSERSLSQEQIELIRRWIDQGAAYERHWSFIPPVRPRLPFAEDDVPSGIDRLIRDALDAKGLAAAPPADRVTLIRRVTFDLTGLPPTLEEIDDFLADESPQAYQRLLDRLLSQEGFGERMASDWLDASRYSDTYGYQVDRDRYVWPWRDWVIRAFNENMPYDQFITSQLAGDLIPGATENEVLATTFNRLHPQKVEGGSVPEEFRMEYVADRTQTVATALMGLTFECCRCHDHKYDPLSQKDYYQLSAFFDNIDEAGLYSYFTPSVPTPTLALPTKVQTAKLSEHHETVLQRYASLQSKTAQRLELASAAAEKRARSNPDAFFAKPIKELEFDQSPPGENTLVEGVVGKAFRLTGDDAVGTDVGNFPRWQPFSISLWMRTPDVKERAVVFHRSRAWTDAASRGYQLLIEEGKLSWSLIHFWPGNAIRVRTIDPIPVDQWLHATVTYDGSSEASGLRIYVNGNLAETEIVRDSLTRQITGGGGDTVTIGERFRDKGFKNGCVDRFRVFDCELSELEIRRLATPNETLKLDFDASRGLFLSHFVQRHDDEIARQRERLMQARQALCKLQDALAEIMVMRELPAKRQSYLLVRGAYDNRGEAVDPGTPASLVSFPDGAPRNRLGLARWLCDGVHPHPLTSRVAVNRLWQICFGTGLVRTPEDFGSQGEPPTHPELLDLLAVDFVESGWDVKRLLKQIMMSATYRQSSRHPDAGVVESDPSNRFLARFPSYRMPAEMLRDNALAVSGRLVSRIGGPPVKPYELEASFKPSQRDSGEGLYRRSLYTYWKRTGPAPAMMTLDAAKRDVCRVQRERTSSPLQAFVLLNGPQYVEAARGLAERLSQRHGDTAQTSEASIRDAFRILTGRRGSEDELNVLGQLYATQRAYFATDMESAAAFLSIGDARPDESLDATHVAALTAVFSTLMNFDQSMMKR